MNKIKVGRRGKIKKTPNPLDLCILFYFFAKMFRANFKQKNKEVFGGLLCFEAMHSNMIYITVVSLGK